ncbi:putative lipid II flippase FtsW [Miniphocaeibacter massiliensis]|uniref:putative lipid II flippase FtsW n=1 Tax=Miniphocaeibacter massiliensis TaxID=2041841 RepID=UPI0013EBAFE5|nr:putative lipid II flippase FtsW [Miniphocaeibacter massiliensis]
MKKNKASIDKRILSVTIILILIGLIMIASSSWPYANKLGKNSYEFFEKQFKFSLLGFVIIFVVSKIDYRIYKKYAGVLFILTIILSIIVLIVGDEKTYSAKRWLNLGFTTIMPSDFLKIGTVFIISKYIASNYKQIKSFKYGFIPMIIFGGISGGLVFLQPDLSTTLVILGTVVAMFVIAGINLRYFATAVFGVGGITVFAILKPNSAYSRMSRVEAWLDPMKDFTNKGWQLAQSLFAVSYGGFFGTGIGRSRHKFSYLSEAHNDFIFAIICEELGFIGAILIILLYVYLIYVGISISFKLEDVFAKFLVIGIMLLIGLQAFTNISVALGLIPPTGLTLPFISYGGSSLIVYMVLIGIILNISKNVQRR